MNLHKDEILDQLADIGNVAQFVSFRQADGIPSQSFSRVIGFQPNHRFDGLYQAVRAILAQAPEGRVNVRSFEPHSPRSNEFVYGISAEDEVVAHVVRLSGQGLDTIVNETVDVADGGVSGVVHGDIVEFAPDDTPRCVERPGAASMERSFGLAMLTAVYGFEPALPEGRARVEFSIHPTPRGVRHEHTLLWELEHAELPPAAPAPKWPNRFSRHIGDKAFGLLVAHLCGQPVPKTLVIGRRVAPFSFGTKTGSDRRWIRTAPVEPEPGHFTTERGWLDPFALLAREDPKGTRIVSVLDQAAVPATYSGAAIVDADGDLAVEGRVGEGDRFMLGIDPPEPLPGDVIADVAARYRDLAERLGPVRFEWVKDDSQVWIVQLHIGATVSRAGELYPGEASEWVEFDVDLGLDRLRGLYSDLEPGAGVILRGEVGMTSHFADLARRSMRPTRLVPGRWRQEP